MLSLALLPFPREPPVPDALSLLLSSGRPMRMEHTQSECINGSLGVYQLSLQRDQAHTREQRERRKMAGRLSTAASRILGGGGLVTRSNASSVRGRAGMGLPVGKHIVPDKPLPVNDELVWDNGTSFPEPCVDRLAPNIGKYEALGWLCGGLSFFAALGLLAAWNDKASKIPFAPKIYPYDNLRVELGGEP